MSSNMSLFKMKPLPADTCAISGFDGEGDMEVPAQMEKDGKIYKVVSISNYAFAKKKNLQKVVLPDTVETISDYAFSESSLTEIEIPASVKEIKQSAFDDCSQLVRVVMAPGLQTLGKYAFSGCSALDYINLPEGLKVVALGTFSDCKNLGTVNLPSTIEKIDAKAFVRCKNLKNINLNDNINDIDSQAFDQTSFEGLSRRFEDLGNCACALERYGSSGEIVIPAEVKIGGNNCRVERISRYAFTGKHIEKVVIPATVKEIEEEAFCNCRELKEIVFSEGLQKIGLRAFMGCESLVRIAFPDSLQTIEDYAFGNCENLEEVNNLDNVESGEYVFEGCPKLNPEEEEQEEEQEEEELINPYTMGRDRSAATSSSDDRKQESFETESGTKVKVYEISLNDIDEDNYIEKAKQLLDDHNAKEVVDKVRRVAELKVVAGLLKKGADNGDPAATYYMGEFVRYGYGFECNPNMAMELFEKSANMGYHEAQNKVGWSYLAGDIVTKNVETGLMWFKKAADNGNVDAMKNLGQYYQFIKQYDKAVEWLDAAANEGQNEAQYRLAECYRKGQGVEQNEERAFEWYLSSAENEYAMAQYFVARCYQTGSGTYQDDEAAAEWYERAANNGHGNAALEIGLCYYNGLGVDQDEERAFEWLYKAADTNCSTKAQCMVGYCYLEGVGVDRDEEEAFKWFEMAANDGNDEAKYYLALQYLNGNGVDEDKEKAFELFQELAEKDNVHAQFYVGICYGNGDGVDADAVKAVEWLEKAAAKGFETANEYLPFYRHMATMQDKSESAALDVDMYCSADECYARRLKNRLKAISRMQPNSLKRLRRWDILKQCIISPSVMKPETV